MDVIRPCNARFENCNDPAAGRNIDDRHGRTSFLTHDQLADLEAFLKAPHGPIGSGPLEAQLEVTSAAMSAPEFGFTFPIPIAGAKVQRATLQELGHGAWQARLGLARQKTLHVAAERFIAAARLVQKCAALSFVVLQCLLI
jgi:hypothetical protein